MPFIGLSRLPRPTVLARPLTGQRAPNSPSLESHQTYRLVAFLRDVGCPFAEHAVRQLRAWAPAHPDVATFVVSHGDNAVTRPWTTKVGGLGTLHLVRGSPRTLYAQWGLGEARLMHFAGLHLLMGVAARWRQGIRNRDATGTRWQRSGLFMVKGRHVTWSHVPESAQEFALPPEDLL